MPVHWGRPGREGHSDGGKLLLSVEGDLNIVGLKIFLFFFLHLPSGSPSPAAKSVLTLHVL